MPKVRIDKLRRKIDALDRALVKLFNRRAELSLEIGRLKGDAGMPMFVHHREREIAANVRRASRGPLSNRALNHLHGELLRLTRATVKAALRRKRKQKTGGAR